MEVKANNILYDPIKSGLNAGTIQDAVDTLSKNAFQLKKTLSGVDLNDCFANGYYPFTNTCANLPVNSSGTMIVLRQTAKHITQIVIPATHFYDVYLRHYRSDGTGYSWSNWYHSEMVLANDNTVSNAAFYKETRTNVPASYDNAFILSFNNKSINPSNYTEASFIITLQARTGASTMYSVVYTGGSYVAKRMDAGNDASYPYVAFTNSGNLFLRMNSGNGTDIVDVFITKTR